MDNIYKGCIVLKLVCMSICVIQVTGLACTFTDYQVLYMCESDQLTGQGIYLDTSKFTGLSVTCTCTVKTLGPTGGAVTFDPVVVDQSNCQTEMLIDEHSFVNNCSSTGARNGYLPSTLSPNLILQGQGLVENCLKVYTQAADVTLDITCHRSEQVTTTKATTSVVTATSIATTTERSFTEGTSVAQVKACPSSRVTDLSWCTSAAAQGPRVYLDSSFFSDQYLSCTCTVRVVNEGGGTVNIYPSVVDNTNCNVQINVDTLSYYIGCGSRNSARTFLDTAESLGLTVSGNGSARYCVLVQASSMDKTLSVQCSQGLLKNIPTSNSTTETSTASVTQETEDTTISPVTTPAASSPTVLQTVSATQISSTSVSTTATSPSTLVTIISEVMSSTTAETDGSTTSPSTESPVISSTLTTEGTSIHSPTSHDATSDMTSSTTSSASSTITSTGTATITTVRKTDDVPDAFPVTEVIVVISVGFVAILFVIAVVLCYRNTSKKKNVEEQKQMLYIHKDTTDDMREIETVTLDNPIYFHEDEEGQQTSAVTSPGTAMYATVNKTRKQTDVLY